MKKLTILMLLTIGMGYNAYASTITPSNYQSSSAKFYAKLYQEAVVMTMAENNTLKNYSTCLKQPNKKLIATADEYLRSIFNADELRLLDDLLDNKKFFELLYDKNNNLTSNDLNKLDKQTQMLIKKAMNKGILGRYLEEYSNLAIYDDRLEKPMVEQIAKCTGKSKINH